MNTQVLVMAKAPVAGRAKTRLGAVVGVQVAADLAAAALLDTLEACRLAFGDGCHLALDGDLDQACRSAEIRTALRGWSVFTQQGESFGDRLVHAHRTVASSTGSPVVQIGMDTPQVTPMALRSVAETLEKGADVVVGPAGDGGWWVLAVRAGRSAAVLVDVPMSVSDTYAATVEAFTRAGASVASVAPMTDVDTIQDAALVGALAPGTRFGRAWTVRSGAPS